MSQCTVIVFGDLGRSPRMINHARMISKELDVKVNLIGYRENNIDMNIQQDKNINIIDLTSPFINKLKKMPRILYLLYAFLRVLIQTIQLLSLFLFQLKKQKFILVQNPPSIPVLSTLAAIKLIRKTPIVIDFHNYGYTLLRMTINNKIINYFAEKYEKIFASFCTFSFCVSDQMKIDLFKNWKINSTSLYDKPDLKRFKVLNSDEKQNILNKYKIKQTDQKIVISSTSWTKDEDFSILLDALILYDECSYLNLHPLIVLITGKGPMKPYYESLINSLSLTKVQIVLLWVESDDYPAIVGSADIGVCLHTSSSGIDLPMKVVDMFGGGVPVFAKEFKAIRELVNNGNGLLFNTAQDLFENFKLVFEKLPKENKLLKNMQQQVLLFRKQDWNAEWNHKARDQLASLLGKK